MLRNFICCLWYSQKVIWVRLRIKFVWVIWWVVCLKEWIHSWFSVLIVFWVIFPVPSLLIKMRYRHAIFFRILFFFTWCRIRGFLPLFVNCFYTVLACSYSSFVAVFWNSNPVIWTYFTNWETTSSAML